MNWIEAYREAHREELLTDLEYRAENLTMLNRAYARMLAEEGMLDRVTYQKIDSGLVRIDKTVTAESADPDKDFFFLYEQALYDEIGGDAACRLHVGRSRNDIYFTLWRMSLREAIWHILDDIAELQRLLEEKAEENLETIIPYYTYGQPAQPGTWAHYLMTIHSFLEGDWRRLIAAYENVNQSPMGAAALAGSSFPINRARLAKLLGFDGVIENTMAANSAVDYYLEMESALGILNTTLGRVGSDLVLFASMGCDFLDCDMSICSGSSIMPQKRNAEAAELLRANANYFPGYLMSSFMAAGSASLFPVHETFLFFRDFWENVKRLRSGLRLLGTVVENSRIRKERAFAQALEGFTTATALAEQLAGETGEPFAKVHHVVGGMICTLMEEDRLKTANMTGELMRRESVKTLGYAVKKSDEELTRMLHPLESLKAKVTGGTPKPEDTRALLARGREKRRQNEAWLKAARQQVEDAYAEVRKGVGKKV